MGTWSSIGGSHRIAWFTELDSAAGVQRMAAIVVRRVDDSSTGETVRFREFIRPLWWALLHRFGLRRWPRRPAHVPRPLPEGWNGAVGLEGPGQVLYSRERGLVRVRGRDYTLPGGDQTLIVLVDETASDIAASVETHAARTPTAPWLPLDPQASRDENRRRVGERGRAAGAVWHAWLEEEPSISAFMARRGSGGGA